MHFKQNINTKKEDYAANKAHALRIFSMKITYQYLVFSNKNNIKLMMEIIIFVNKLVSKIIVKFLTVHNTLHPITIFELLLLLLEINNIFIIYCKELM